MASRDNLTRLRNRRDTRWVSAIVLALLTLPRALFAEEPQLPPLSGHLYCSIFKVQPSDEKKSPRQVVKIDMATGQFEEVGAEGIGVHVTTDQRQLACWKIGPELIQGSRGERNDEVWIHDLAGEAEPRMINNGSAVGGWLNDNKQLIIVRMIHPSEANNQKWQYTNWLVNADGSNAEQIDLPITDRVIDCTPDGQWMLIYTDKGLFVKEAGEAKKTRVSSIAHRTFKGRISPDAKQVVYLDSLPRNGDALVIVNRDGTQPHVIHKSEGLAEPEDACWSPDGKHIAVAVHDWQLENGQKIMRAGEPKDCRLLVVDVDGKNARTIRLEGVALSELDEPDWKG